jgi:hypothetical protein
MMPPGGIKYIGCRLIHRSAWKVNYWTGVQILPPARLFSSRVVQDHPYEMVDARVWKQVEDEA